MRKIYVVLAILVVSVFMFTGRANALHISNVHVEIFDTFLGAGNPGNVEYSGTDSDVTFLYDIYNLPTSLAPIIEFQVMLTDPEGMKNVFVTDPLSLDAPSANLLPLGWTFGYYGDPFYLTFAAVGTGSPIVPGTEAYVAIDYTIASFAEFNNSANWYEGTKGIQHYTTRDNSIGSTYSGATVVPEPTTMILLGSGLIGLAVLKRKRN